MATNGNGYGADGADYSSKKYPVHNTDARYKSLPQLEGRLKGFIGGYYAGYNLSPLLYAHREDSSDVIRLEYWQPAAGSKPTVKEALSQTYKPVKKGLKLGPNWSNHWFKVTIRVPESWAKYERVQLEFDALGEAMVFDTNGDPYHGLTGGNSHDRRAEFIIPAEHRKAGSATYFIEASCNGMFGVNDEMFGEMDGQEEAKEQKEWKLKTADLCVPNMDALRLKWDFEFLRDAGEKLPQDSGVAQRAKWTANAMMNAFKAGDLASCKLARKEAEVALGPNWERVVEEESKHAAELGGTLWAVGHCHIDTAWLWPFSVTQQKSARSWSTQCDLMDRYPEYVFTATQPQQFKWVEQLYPGLFKRIMEKVHQGRFQPLGCTWVEMDTNMPSGESLARQFLYGQRYFEKRFGKRSETFVLPDTFGYSSQLPQISRLSGAPNFFTQKISWNNINKFPHSTFNWAGIDGSQVLTHMTPVDSYNADCTIEELRRAIANHKNIDVTKNALLLFGFGDGGGGPTEPQLERLRRTQALTKQNDAGGALLPRIRNAGSFEQFYDAVRAETQNGALLPVWRGELYLEIHRATYTSQAQVKKGNRKSEILMREAEYAATMASIFDKTYTYPKEQLDEAWEDLLLCQFHDVLPGSSINEVYVDADEIYVRLQKNISKVINSAYDVLYPGTAEVSKESTELVALNPLPGTPRREVISVPRGSGTSGAQATAEGMSELVLVSTDGSSDTAYPTALSGPKATATNVDGGVQLTNDNISVTIRDGRIVSFVDVKLKKELISPGQTGGLVIFEDHPNYWDAWDVDYFHEEKAQQLKFKTVDIIEKGPLRASVRAVTKYGKSTIAFTISLDAVAASTAPNARSLLRFDAKADWHQKHEFLKFELPLDIRSDSATYDTQFGVLQRPTHRNTSWDAAKFEVCAHKFADLSEWGYGVAIVNDCKYGYACRGNVLTLSLLRGPRMPDPDTDMGEHEFSFGIYPHVGSWGESDVVDVAYAFNHPLRLRSGARAASQGFKGTPFALEGARNVVLETLKRAEDDPSAIIIRLFEQYGGHADATLRISGLDVKKAQIVNILEDELEDLDVEYDGSDETVRLPFRGFEIKTVKLKL